MPKVQSFKSHTRFDPPVHFFVFPMLLLNIVVSIYFLVKHWSQHPHICIWYVVMSLVLFVGAGAARGAALRAQDRIIRLEERLRYQALLSPSELPLSSALTTKQVIALRFASDVELPHLVRRALAESMSPKEIKESIKAWRPDYERV